MKQELIGQIFVSKGICKSGDVERGLDIQLSYGGKLGNILLNMGVVTEDQLLESLAEQLALEWLPSVREVELLKLKDGVQICRQNHLYPFREDDVSLSVLTNNPLNFSVFSLLEAAVGKRVLAVLSSEENLKQLSAQGDANDLLVPNDNFLDIDDEIDKLKELASEAPVIKLVNSLLGRAVERNASDIHFEALRRQMKVRFRVDGILQLIEQIPQDLKLAIIARLKLISSMNIAENRLPQDGRISVRIAGKEIDIRASSVPTHFGESFVLRLLGKENVDYSLESLGFYPDHIALVRRVAQKSNGIFLATGPTGSGKTTTLYSMLSEINTDALKVITVEDPVEYEFKGVNQINVRPEIDFTFANALRSVLRQDPDTILVGEIRDLETVEIAIQAALTGHLVFSTLHTNDVLGSITRLVDMGVDFFLIKAALAGVMAQRLVRQLCPFCKQEEPLNVELLSLYRVEELLKRHPFIRCATAKPVGCSRCNHTGYKGRLVIAEVLCFDEQLLDRVGREGNLGSLEELGCRTMFQDGMLKVMEGRTSVDEVLRVAQ